MNSLYERIRLYVDRHPGCRVCPPEDLGPVTLATPIEGGYLYRDATGGAAIVFRDVDTHFFSMPLDKAYQLINEHSAGDALASTTRDEQLKIIADRMREVAKTWGKDRQSWDIMLDVESFGDCLPSLAIVPFDIRTGETMPIEGCVLLTLDIDWQIRAGLLPDQSTLRWWLTKTSDDARTALYDLPGSYHCRTPDQLADYLVMMGHAWGVLPEQEHHQVWGKPASYDWPKVERLCKAANTPVPFHFRTSRCLRTLSAIGTKPTKQERDQWKIDNGICSHDPYDDCRLQAWEASRALATSAYELPHGGSDGRSFYHGHFYRYLPEGIAPGTAEWSRMQVCRFITTHPDDGGTALVEVFSQATQDTHYIMLDWDQFREEVGRDEWVRSI